MDPAEAAQKLAGALRDDRLVALVGSGASASVTQAGRRYQGLPLPREFVHNLANQADSTYIDDSAPFDEACEQVVQRDGRLRLEELLVRAYDRPENASTLPAHKILAWLPFRTYITSNYDLFLERELRATGRDPAVIVENEDLPRTKPGTVPVIKYHGCVSRPSTLVATTADYAHLSARGRLLRQLITVSLAQNSLLVIGHGLRDEDLRHLLDDLLNDLDEYAPTLYVVRDPTDGTTHDIGHKHHLILEDLTEFLSRVLHAYRSLSFSEAVAGSAFGEDWINSAFFAQLRQATVLPSETQVLDAFLSHLDEEISAREDVPSVIDDANIAVARALAERPNYSALDRTWSALKQRLNKSPDTAAAEGAVGDLIQDRSSRRARFAQAGRKVIQRDDRVLLYSQSQRVIQTLEGVPMAHQRTCDLFVAECRPKSPGPYEDAIAICRQLANSGYSITVCPDVVAMNLLANRQISRVLMGTHAVYLDQQGSAYAFVNTCGSAAFALLAESYEIPLTVVGEEIKMEIVDPSTAEDHLYSHQEHDLLTTAIGLVELSTQRGAVEHTNIGYDLIPVAPNMEIVVPDAVASS